ncbi:UDP-N-acetylmuramyl pentapeptide phosphotransferase [Lysinibacillus sphaericus]|uniref:UDP-N-acetylmuramyl pentapeptide phosphotransferase n=1 Tax=Lysinibacillus sphaericus TaxID=1421 RepID=UPI000563A325|nr:UDP-N-acetylmuramyl pentapeptide phosphotransferase [Lysinibacillus sphaericus]QTB24450.1 UDP-N-acetylmuramyl pentapeptide phosphotransferase [Lysinibacillus sphaericus]
MLYIALLIGIAVIMIANKLTQAFKLSSIWGLISQICASFVLIMVGGLEVNYIHLSNHIELGYLAIPFSLLFLVGFTNVMKIETGQKSFILLLPLVSLVCFSMAAFIMGHSFILIIGISSCLAILLILLYSYVSGNLFIGKSLTTSIGFIIAVLSISLIKLFIVAIYIPIFTLALPFTLYYFIQDKFTSVQAIIISTLTAVIFGVFIFIVPTHLLWYPVVGITIMLVIMQSSRKFRII